MQHRWVLCSHRGSYEFARCLMSLYRQMVLAARPNISFLRAGRIIVYRSRAFVYHPECRREAVLYTPQWFPVWPPQWELAQLFPHIAR